MKAQLEPAWQVTSSPEQSPDELQSNWHVLPALHVTLPLQPVRAPAQVMLQAEPDAQRSC